MNKRDMTVSISKSLQSFINPNSSPEFVSEISGITYQIAITYLKLVHKKFHKFILQNDTSIEELAIDCIAPIFDKNSDGYYFNFKNAIEQSQFNYKTEEGSIFILNKIVAEFVENHIINLLKSSDSYFSETLLTVQKLIKKYDFKELNYFGQSFIVEKDVLEISGLVIGEKEFNLLPKKLFNDKRTLLQSIFNHLKSKTTFYPAIPLTALVQQLKNKHADEFSLFDEAIDSEDSIENNSNLKISLDLSDKSRNSYLLSGSTNPAIKKHKK